MSATEIKVFLSHLAIAGKVSVSIRNQAKSALQFLYRQVLKIDEPWQTDLAAVRQDKHLPVVLTVAEVLKVSALGLVVGDGAAPKLIFQFSRLACAGFPERRVIWTRGPLLRAGCIQPGASQYCPPDHRPGTDRLE